MNKADAAISDGHECVVLSALMNGEDALSICADDFSSPPNRTIFERVSGLANRGLLAVTDALRFAGELDKVGGAGRITEIATLPHDEQNLKYALDQVLEHSGARQAAKIGEQLHKGEITPEQAQEKLATLIKTKANTTEREPRIRFFSPCLLRDFVPDNDIVLIGDCHIMRGEVFVIGGEPGVGKSLAATQLAVSGATQRYSFGHTVHRQFQTMIVQTENGRYRLRLEYSSLDCDEIENWIRVSEPPPFGLTLTN
jgi:AAA domain/DnaB-like helicase N terminal domain